MSWANLVKKTIPISSRSISTNSENKTQIKDNSRLLNPAPFSPETQENKTPPPKIPRSQIRLASLKECLDYRHSGNPWKNLYYSRVSGKSQITLSEFYRLYQRPLQLLYKNRIQEWGQRTGNQIPSLSSFIVLAWIFSE
jgi:hypothetical protein